MQKIIKKTYVRNDVILLLLNEVEEKKQEVKEQLMDLEIS